MKKSRVIFSIALTILISTSTNIRSEDNHDAENTYFDHRVNFFDIKQITNKFLCSTAIQETIPKWETSQIYKAYIQEAVTRGLSEAKCAQISNKF